VGGLFNLEKLNYVYDMLEDDISREVFNYRLNFAATRDWHAFLNLFDYWDSAIDEFRAFYDEHPLPVMIFGTDRDGIYVFKTLRKLGYPIKGFLMYNSPNGGDIEGIPVMDFSETQYNKGEYSIFLASTRFTDKMYSSCLHMPAIDRNLIFYPMKKRYCMFTPCQYFDFFEPHEHEIFVDAGAYDGETTVCFTKWAKYGYDMVYLFEPDVSNESICRNNLKAHHIDRYELYMEATGEKEERVNFNGGLMPGSSISENGENIANITTLDNVLNGRNVTFIKLDVEGFEAQTLMGGKNTIPKCGPRMAICAYHHPWDFVNLPLLIKEIAPDYQMAMRHYTTGEWETVLYAWKE